MSKKRLTKKGKERILEKLFVTKKKIRLCLSVYSSSLQLMKRNVKIFQQAEPAVFRVHGEQLDVFEEFLISFIKSEVLATNNRVSRLTQIDFNSSRNQLPKNLLSIGTIATKIIK